MVVFVVSNSCCTKFMNGSTGFLTVVLAVTVESLYYAKFGSIQIDCVIMNCVIKGQFYKGIIGK